MAEGERLAVAGHDRRLDGRMQVRRDVDDPATHDRGEVGESELAAEEAGEAQQLGGRRRQGREAAHDRGAQAGGQRPIVDLGGSGCHREGAGLVERAQQLGDVERVAGGGAEPYGESRARCGAGGCSHDFGDGRLVEACEE